MMMLFVSEYSIFEIYGFLIKGSAVFVCIMSKIKITLLLNACLAGYKYILENVG